MYLGATWGSIRVPNGVSTFLKHTRSTVVRNWWFGVFVWLVNLGAYLRIELDSLWMVQYSSTCFGKFYGWLCIVTSQDWADTRPGSGGNNSRSRSRGKAVHCMSYNNNESCWLPAHRPPLLPWVHPRSMRNLPQTGMGRNLKRLSWARNRQLTR